MKKVKAYQKFSAEAKRSLICGCPMYQQIAMFTGNWALMRAES